MSHLYYAAGEQRDVTMRLSQSQQKLRTPENLREIS